MFSHRQGHTMGYKYAPPNVRVATADKGQSAQLSKTPPVAALSLTLTHQPMKRGYVCPKSSASVNCSNAQEAIPCQRPAGLPSLNQVSSASDQKVAGSVDSSGYCGDCDTTSDFGETQKLRAALASSKFVQQNSLEQSHKEGITRVDSEGYAPDCESASVAGASAAMWDCLSRGQSFNNSNSLKKGDSSADVAKAVLATYPRELPMLREDQTDRHEKLAKSSTDINSDDLYMKSGVRSNSNLKSPAQPSSSEIEGVQHCSPAQLFKAEVLFLQVPDTFYARAILSYSLHIVVLPTLRFSRELLCTLPGSQHHYTMFNAACTDLARCIFVDLQVPRHLCRRQLAQQNQLHARNPNPSQSCLLYTSPSPRDRQKSRMPSSA